MAEEFKIKIVSDAVESGAKGTSTGGKGGSAIGLGAKLGVGLALATSALSLISDAISTILKPVKSLVKSIFRLIGELLRPIADILIIILKPILLLIKPLISLFKTMMSPFMSIAREMGAISSQQMASGDVSGAVNTAITAFETIMGPFIVSAASISLQLLNTLLVTLSSKLIGAMIGNLLEPIALLVGIFSEKTADKVRGIATNVQETLDSAANTWITESNAKLTEGTFVILDQLQANAEEKLAEMKELYGEELNLIHTEIPQSALQAQEQLTKAGTDAITSAEEVGLIERKQKVSNYMGDSNSILEQGLNSIESKFKTFVDNMNSIADDLGGGDSGDRKSEKERDKKRFTLSRFLEIGGIRTTRTI